LFGKNGCMKAPYCYAIHNLPVLFYHGFDPLTNYNSESVTELTLRLLMSYIYIYGAPSKVRNANVVYIWTYEYIIPYTARFSEKKIIQHSMCFDFLYSIFLKRFSCQEEFSEIDINLHILQVK